MSRSHRKTTITPNYRARPGVGKYEKRVYQRRFRSLQKSAMQIEQYDACPKYKRESIDVWATRREGKCYWTSRCQHEFDYRFVKLMRK